MMLFLSTADTELLTLSHAVEGLPDDLGPIRAANPSDFHQPEAAMAFLSEVLPETRLVVLRLLGGRRAFAGFSHLLEHCRSRGVPLLAWPGDQEPDPDLQAATTVPVALANEAVSYLVHGGVENMRQFWCFLSDQCLGTAYGWEPARPQPRHGIYRPGVTMPLTLAEYSKRHLQPGRATVGLLFYRAHWLSGNLAFVDALVEAIEANGCNALPVFSYSLKPEDGQRAPAVFRDFLAPAGKSVVDVLVSTLSFSLGRLDAETGRVADHWSADALRWLDVPIIQAMVSTSERAQWEESPAGLGPLDTAMNVAMPEFDGRIVSVPVSFKQVARQDRGLGAPIRRYQPHPDRVAFVARLAARWANLKRKPNREKRVAILLTNYPSKNSRIGNAVGLDTPNSVIRILHALRDAGYRVEAIPADGDALIHQIIARCSNDSAYLTASQLALAAGHLSQDAYQQRFATLPDPVQNQLRSAWGDPPGEVLTWNRQVVIPGLQLGHVFVGLQPPRGFGENPIAVYHSPDLVPTHQYIGYYQWLRDEFQADAVIHVGKHGTLEWLPGKGIGLSQSCFPEVVLADLPNFYPYIINNPGEGTQAKRRSHATIIDHLIPAMTHADTYTDLARLEQLLDQYYQVQTLDPAKLTYVQQEIWETIVQASLDRDLGTATRPAAEEFDDFLGEVDGYLCELKAAQIRDGLHTLGTLPDTPERWADLVLALVRLPNGSVPSLPEAVASALGLDLTALRERPGQLWRQPLPRALAEFPALYTAGDVWLAIEALSRRVILEILAGADPWRVLPGVAERPGALSEVLGYIEQILLPRLRQTPQEIDNLLHGLAGGFIEPGPSGAPTRGMADILPTGRNFYSVDPRALPSQAAWQVGQDLARRLIDRYLAEEGSYPESVGLVVWGTAAMRTQGDDIAEALALMGVRPLWQKESRRVIGLEVIPLAELGRPRIDVTIRMSGFFRDAFPNVVHLVDQAVQMVAERDEDVHDNYVRKHYLSELAVKRANGVDEAQARTTSLYRIFGSKPGTYGSGLLPLIESRNWESDEDLARVYVTWSGYAYTRDAHGTPAAAEFRWRLAHVQVATKNQDNREHDIFDSDDYFQEHGGMVATIRSLTGRNPKQYFGDSANPQAVRVRDLAEEARRVFRTRVVNPKWIDSVRRHGYKGAVELASTVDFLFGYDATTHVIEDWMYSRLTQTYVLDPEMKGFFAEANPWALKDIAERLLEAAERGLWEEPEEEVLKGLREALLEAEAALEGKEESV